MLGIGIALSLLASSISPGQQASDRYASGQVWEYRSRPGDEGSLLKIQAVDYDPAFARSGPIYHISVIGLHLKDPELAPLIAHLPVTQATLDASVTVRHKAEASFPDAAPGIAEWHRAKGGVYSESVAEIVGDLDTQTAPHTAPM